MVFDFVLEGGCDVAGRTREGIPEHSNSGSVMGNPEGWHPPLTLLQSHCHTSWKTCHLTGHGKYNSIL